MISLRCVRSRPTCLRFDRPSVHAHRHLAHPLRCDYRNTPLPPEIPHGLNPPDGAILYYYLASKPSGEIKIEIFDSANNLIRSYSSAPIPPVTINPLPNVPDYWFYRPEPIPTEVGTNRINWDLHYTRPPSLIQNYSLEKFDAIYHNTVYDPQGPLVVPGLHGEAHRQRHHLNADRQGEDGSARRGPGDAGRSRGHARPVDEGVQVHVHTWDGYQQVRDMRAQLKTITDGQLPPQVANAASEFDAKMAGIEGELPAAQGGAPAAGAGQGGRGATPQIGFGALNIQFGGDGQTGYINAFGTADVAPTPAERRAYQISCTHLNSAIAAWTAIDNQDVSAFNTLLRQNKLSPLPMPTKALATTEVRPAGGHHPAGHARARRAVSRRQASGFRVFTGRPKGRPFFLTGASPPRVCAGHRRHHRKLTSWYTRPSSAAASLSNSAAISLSFPANRCRNGVRSTLPLTSSKLLNLPWPDFPSASFI